MTNPSLPFPASPQSESAPPPKKQSLVLSAFFIYATYVVYISAGHNGDHRRASLFVLISYIWPYASESQQFQEQTCSTPLSSPLPGQTRVYSMAEVVFGKFNCKT